MAPRWRSRKPTFVVKAEASVSASPSSMAKAIPEPGASTRGMVGEPTTAGERGGSRRPRAPAPPAGSLAALLRAVDLDLFLRHGLRHLALLLDGVLVEADALLRHRALLDDRLLGVERDLVLLLGDRGALGRVADVGVRDRLALDANLLTANRDRRLDVLGHHVLAQARLARLALGLADRELLLGARHRVVGRRPRRVAADRALDVALA